MYTCLYNRFVHTRYIHSYINRQTAVNEWGGMRRTENAALKRRAIYSIYLYTCIYTPTPRYWNRENSSSLSRSLVFHTRSLSTAECCCLNNIFYALLVNHFDVTWHITFKRLPVKTHIKCIIYGFIYLHMCRSNVCVMWCALCGDIRVCGRVVCICINNFVNAL